MCRRITSKRLESFERYQEDLTEQFQLHQIEEKLDSIFADGEGCYPASPDIQERHDKLDKQMQEIMIHCEKRCCRKLYMPTSPCSPQYSLWYKRAQLFGNLIQMKSGRVRNAVLLCRKARKLGIVAPARWSLEELQYGRALSQAWNKSLKPAVPAMRREHLGDRLVQAEADKDEEAAKAIRTMIWVINGAH